MAAWNKPEHQAESERRDMEERATESSRREAEAPFRSHKENILKEHQLPHWGAGKGKK